MFNFSVFLKKLRFWLGVPAFFAKNPNHGSFDIKFLDKIQPPQDKAKEIACKKQKEMHIFLEEEEFSLLSDINISRNSQITQNSFQTSFILSIFCMAFFLSLVIFPAAKDCIYSHNNPAECSYEAMMNSSIRHSYFFEITSCLLLLCSAANSYFMESFLFEKFREKKICNSFTKSISILLKVASFMALMNFGIFQQRLDNEAWMIFCLAPLLIGDFIFFSNLAKEKNEINHSSYIFVTFFLLGLLYCLLSLVEYAFNMKFEKKESNVEMDLRRLSGFLSIFLLAFHFLFMASVAWELEKREREISFARRHDQTLYENVV